MDLLLTELSASLIEDMKDLDEHERRIFWTYCCLLFVLFQ